MSLIAQGFDNLSQEMIDDINPLNMEGSTPAISEQLSTPGGILSRVLDFAFPLAGLILFIMIVWGGFEVIAGAASKKSLDAGKQRITAALVGFMMLFASYWIIQIVEIIFGVKIF